MDALVPIRTLSKRNQSSLSQIKEKVEKAFLRSYTKFILDGLERGFTVEDILSMKEKKDFFRLPLYWNSLLLSQKIKLKVFSFFSRAIFPSRSFYYGMKQILSFYAESAPKSWNPGQIDRDLTIENGDLLELEFHVIPSPYGFKWEKPRSFFYSLRNYLTPFWGHKIGHAFIVLKKNNIPVLATGMTGETNYQVLFKLLFKRGGFEFLFQSFRGRLETAQFVLEDIKRHKEKNRIQTLAYQISPLELQKCLDHLDSWIERGTYKNYGLPYCLSGPQGASCTSFAVHFLKIIGKLDEKKKMEWKRQVNIPKSLLKSEENSVGVFRLFTNLIIRNRWVNKESFSKLFFWDPDLIYDWIKNNSLP